MRCRQSPDTDPILRREIHAVAFGDAVEVQKLIELLQGRVDTQIRQGIHIVNITVRQLQRTLCEIVFSDGTEESIVVKVLFFIPTILLVIFMMMIGIK